jgi:glycogen(starch) synthase
MALPVRGAPSVSLYGAGALSFRSHAGAAATVTPSLLVVTPWYPTADRPYYGTFVRAWVNSLVQVGERPTVVHLDYIAGAAELVVTDTNDTGVPLVHVTVPVPLDPTPVQIAHAYAAALRPLMTKRWSGVRAIHAHVMFPLGWAVASTMPEGTRLVVTEHTGKLRFYFRYDETRQMYAEALERSASCLTVGADVADLIRANVPAALGDRVVVVGNPVGFDRFPLRSRLDNRLRRWLFLGNLVEGKGLAELLDAYALAKETAGPGDEGPTHLTIVGDGSLREELVSRAAELGIAEDVSFTGAIPSDQVPAVLAEHDLLVHLSRAETFGMSVVEAVSAGVPVIVTRCGGPEETLAHAEALGAVEFVPRRPQASSVVWAYQQLMTKASNADWVNIRRLLEYRYSPAAIGATLLRHLEPTTASRSPAIPWRHIIAVTVDSPAPRSMQPLLQHMSAAGSPAKMISLFPNSHRSPLLVLTRAVARVSPKAAHHLVRLYVTRRPRVAAGLVQQVVKDERPDALIVDEFVNAAIVTLKPDLPPTMSVTRPSKLWRNLSKALGDKPDLTPLPGGSS